MAHLFALLPPCVQVASRGGVRLSRRFGPLRLAAKRAAPLGENGGIGGYRPESTLRTIPPSRQAAREVPVPILFLGAPGWAGSKRCTELYGPVIEELTKSGYESLLVDLDPECLVQAKATSSAETLQAFESEIQHTLRVKQGNMGFPPVLFTRGSMTLLGEQYASSHPLSALLLQDPPLSTEHAVSAFPRDLPTPLNKFDFEARFPVEVLWSTEGLQALEEGGASVDDAHRIERELAEERGEPLDRWVVRSGLESQIIQWLEEYVGLAHSAQSKVPGAKRKRPTPKPKPFESPDEERIPQWFKDKPYAYTPGARRMPIELVEDDLEEKFVTGWGAGGQAINKLSTCVQLVHRPTGVRINCQETRSQKTNRLIARRRLSNELDLFIRGDRSVQGKRSAKVAAKKANKRKKSNKKAREAAAEAAESAGTRSDPDLKAA